MDQRQPPAETRDVPGKYLFHLTFLNKPTTTSRSPLRKEVSIYSGHAFDALQRTFQCCGVNGPLDFANIVRHILLNFLTFMSYGNNGGGLFCNRVCGLPAVETRMHASTLHQTL